MRKLRFGLLCAAAAILPGNGAPAAAERVIDRDARVLPIVVDGQEVAMEFAPDGTGAPVFSAATAARLGLKGSLFAGVHMVGNTKVHAKSNKVAIDWGNGSAQTRRAFFPDREWTYPGEGRVSAAALPFSRITYRLRPAQAGEQIVRMPLFEQDMVGFFARLPTGPGEEDYVPVLFSFERAETMATAAAGAALAQHFAGRMTGAARDLTVEYGIRRPGRAMDFAEPAHIAGLPLRNVVVRSSDTGSTAAIADADAPADPNEIVVTGSKRKPVKRLWIGLDTLAPCSTLTFDRAAREIRLSCLVS